MHSHLHPRSSRSQRGSGLIEVLVLILVLGVGMLAMGKIHTVLLRDGGTANNRAIATSLAQEKIDDLRGFKWLNASSSNGEGCGTGIFCYSEIATNAGGNEAAPLPAGDVTINNQPFTLAWTVVDNGQFKLVTATVSWTDQNGTASVQLQTAILADDANITALGASGGGGPIFPGPKVTYNPIGVPDAVPVEIGDSKYRESSKPVPDVSQHGQSTVVKFDTTAYTTPDNKIDSKEEFVTLSCVCEFNGTGNARTPTRMVWNHDKKQLEPELGAMVSKTVGRKPTTGQAATQNALCDNCCQDHHDSSNGSYPKYDPQRISGSGSTDVHKHYWPDASGQLQEATSGNYLESCRFKRIDGLFYLMQDWLMRDLVVMPKDNYLSNTSTLAAYRSYLETGMSHWALGSGNAPSKNTLVDRNTVELAQGQQAQLLARGIYVDTIYQCRPGALLHYSGQVCPSGNDPTAIDETYRTDVQAIKSAGGTTDDWRKHIAMNEVNLTMLGIWESSTTTKVTVDNQALQDIVDINTGYYTTYYRGRVTGATQAGPSSIKATARTGNTGLTSGVMSTTGNVDGYGTDPNDDASTVNDTITVTRSGTSTTYGISGNLQLTFIVQADKPKPNSWGANAAPNSGVICTSTGTAINPGYSCAVPSGWTGTITPFATAGGGGNDPSGTAYYFSPTSKSYSNVTSAQTAQNYLFCKNQALCP